MSMKSTNGSTLVVALTILALVASPLAAAEPETSLERTRAEIQQRNDWPQLRNLDAEYLGVDTSARGLEAHREQMLQVQSEVVRMQLPRVQVTTTFAHPLSIAELTDVLSRHDIEGWLYYAFVDEGRSTSTLAASIDPRRLERGLEIGREFETDEAGWVGVVAVIGMVPGDLLPALQADDRVWLADVSADRVVTVNPERTEYVQHFGWPLHELRKASIGR
ncbi:MAG: hypothetical protein AAGC60_06905 [Acidobacteriota bacterium]